MCRLSWNLGTSTSWNPQGLSRPVMGLLYLYLNICTGRNPCGSHKVEACLYAYCIQNVNYKLKHRIAHYHIIFTSQFCSFMLVNLTYFRILIISSVSGVMPRLACRAFIHLLKKTPWGWYPGAETCKTFNILHEFYFMKCVCWMMCRVWKVAGWSHCKDTGYPE